VSVPESAEALLERVLARVAELEAALVERDRVIAVQGERIAELERRLVKDSSRPSSSDAPWVKQPAKKRSSRVGSGRRPGKQPGSASFSRGLIDDPDQRWEIHPGCCGSCAASLRGAEEHGRQRRQIVDVTPTPPPTVTEYQRISKVCPCCGAVTTPDWDDARVPVAHRGIVGGRGRRCGSARKPLPVPRC
jgi:transposase